MRTESPEINPYIYGYIISDTSAETSQWEKEQTDQHTVLGQLGIPMQKNKAESLPHATHTKINSKNKVGPGRRGSVY